jgi:hypothetical protein
VRIGICRHRSLSGKRKTFGGNRFLIRSLTSDQYIPGEELTKNKKELVDYGIKPFHRSLILQHGNERVEIRLGNQTVGEDELFFQLIGKDEFIGACFFFSVNPRRGGWVERFSCCAVGPAKSGKSQLQGTNSLRF